MAKRFGSSILSEYGGCNGPTFQTKENELCIELLLTGTVAYPVCSAKVLAVSYWIDQLLKGNFVKTYIFRASVELEEDGRWSSWIESLPGCAAWGYSREEALTALKDAAEAYIEDVIEAGDPLPEGVAVIEGPVVTVTL